MFLDNGTTFIPKGTSLAGLTGAGVNSEQFVDLGGPAIGGGARDIGVGTNGNGLFLTVALNGVTASDTLTTLQFDLQGAVDNGSGAPGTWNTYASSGPLNVAELTATTGEQYAFGITMPTRPPGLPLPRFLQLKRTCSNSGTATGTITAGTLYAGLTIGRDDQVAYVSGFTPPPTQGAGS